MPREFTLEAQRAAVTHLCSVWDLKLIRPTFYEREPVRRKFRPQLLLAIERCQEADATLVIAHASKLSRDLAFIALLRHSGINFIAADMPEWNTLTIEALFSTLNGAAAATKARVGKADDYAESLRERVAVIRAAGHTTLRAIASELARSGAVPPREGHWHAATVRNLLARLDQ